MRDKDRIQDLFHCFPAGLLVKEHTKLTVAQYIQPIVRGILEDSGRYEWSLQGFGMLRAYVSKELRLHVWNSSFTTPNVSTIHDHPWHMESVVIVGRIVNTRYDVHWASDVTARRPRVQHVRSKIVCGVSGPLDPDEVRMRGENVWLDAGHPETYGPGDTYHQNASEVHSTSFDDGTVTLVRREFLPDTEHANVFFRPDDGWVSARPRPASADEVTAFVSRALLRF